MDTSSPWGQAPQTTSSGETGWADFGAFSSGGGEGMEGFLAQGEESMDDGKGEGWSPAMASSPEATMLDCATVDQSPHRAASPALLSRLAAPPDISDNNANPAPVPSDQDNTDRIAPANNVADRLAATEEPVPAADSTVGEAAAAQPESLTDNFSFLAARGLISSNENSGECESSTAITSTSSEVTQGEKVVGRESSSIDKESNVVESNTQTDQAVEQ